MCYSTAKDCVGHFYSVALIVQFVVLQSSMLNKTLLSINIFFFFFQTGNSVKVLSMSMSSDFQFLVNITASEDKKSLCNFQLVSSLCGSQF